MPLEQQVISLDLAKELAEVMKEKGVTPPHSLYAYYGNAGEWQKTIVQTYIYDDEDSDFVQAKLLPAYTVAELGMMLPAEIGENGEFTFETSKLNNCWAIYYSSKTQTKASLVTATEADARCKMLIYLLKNNLITLK